jgi:WD40 repeat protein
MRSQAELGNEGQIRTVGIKGSRMRVAVAAFLIAFLLSFPAAVLSAAIDAKSAPAGERLDRYGDPLPAGAVLRLGTVRLRHPGGGVSVAFSPDGRALASTADFDRQIRFWDVKTGRLLRTFGETGQRTPHVIAFSPDGTKLAVVCSDGAVECFNVGDGKRLWEEPGHRAAGETVVFAPDGRRFATAGGDKKVRVWETGTGHALSVMSFTEDFVDPRVARPVAFSGDGKRLAIGDGKDIVFCDPTEGREIARIKNAHGYEVLGLAFAHGGEALISSGSRYIIHQRVGVPVAELRMWQAQRGTLLRDFFGKTEELTTGCVFALTRDGRTIVSEQAHKLIIWDAATGRMERSIPSYWLPLNVGKKPGHISWTTNARGMACSPDGTTLAVAGMSYCNILLWDLTSGRQKLAFSDSPTSAATEIACAPDGSRIATASWGTVRVYDAVQGKQTNAFAVSEYFPSACNRLAYSGDGKTLVGACFEQKNEEQFGFVRIWNAETTCILREFGALRDAPRVAVSLDGSIVALEAAEGFDPGVRHGRVVIIAETRTGAKRRRIPISRRLAGLALSPDAAKVAAVDVSGSIDVFDTATGEVVRHAVVARTAHEPAIAVRIGSRGVVFSAAISADCSRAVVSTFGDDAASVWDLNKGVELRRLQLDSEGSLASMIALSPDKRVIATSPWIGPGVVPRSSSIRFYDVESGRLIKRYSVPEGNVATPLAFTPDGRRLISGMADGTALVWEVPAL